MNMKAALVALVVALVVAPAMGGNMGPEQKPEWAVGPDGDTSKSIKTDNVPKNLKEATQYLYFDDMPTASAASLGKHIKPVAAHVGKAQEPAAKKPEAKVEPKAEAKVEPKDEAKVELKKEPLREPKLSSAKEADTAVPDQTPVLSELGERVQNMLIVHKHTAIIGGVLAAMVAVAAVLRSKSVVRRIEQATEFGSKGEFTPLLRARREEVAYGALRV